MAWSDFLSDIDWSGIVTRAIPATIGATMAANANERAAQAVAQANLQAAQQMSAAEVEAARLTSQGAERAQARLEPIIERTAPAVDYLGRVVADQGVTPAQQQRIMDTRRETANLLASRLGGRSATAIASRAAGNLENQIYEANRARSDEAAARLAGLNTSAINAAGGADINLGNQLAYGARNTGTNIARGTTATGEQLAQSGIATGQVRQEALGQIMSPSLLDVLKSYTAEERKGSYTGGVKAPGA